MEQIDIHKVERNYIFTIHDYHKATLDGELNKVLFKKKVVEKYVSGLYLEPTLYLLAISFLSLIYFMFPLSDFWVILILAIASVVIYMTFSKLDSSSVELMSFKKDYHKIIPHDETLEVYAMGEHITKNPYLKVALDKLIETNPYDEVIDTVGGEFTSSSGIISSVLFKEIDSKQYYFVSVVNKGLFNKEKVVKKHFVSDNGKISSEESI